MNYAVDLSVTECFVERLVVIYFCYSRIFFIDPKPDSVRGRVVSIKPRPPVRGRVKRKYGLVFIQ